MEFRVRRATDADQDSIRRMLFRAWRWKDPWSEIDFRQHSARDEPDSYVDDFGRRPGDVGYVAERPSEGSPIIGACWCRLFDVENPRNGYLASNVPELVVAVSAEARGHGVGRALMNRLIRQAEVAGAPGLSLHVSAENARAQQLYRTLGFVVVDDRGREGIVMVKQLPG